MQNEGKLISQFEEVEVSGEKTGESAYALLSGNCICHQSILIV